jgi:hypothetical protein
MPPSAPDEFHEHSTLHAHAGRWADSMARRSKSAMDPAHKLTAGPSRASGCGPPASKRNVISSVSSGEGLEQHMTGSSIHAGGAAAIKADATH